MWPLPRSEARPRRMKSRCDAAARAGPRGAALARTRRRPTCRRPGAHRGRGAARGDRRAGAGAEVALYALTAEGVPGLRRTRATAPAASPSRTWRTTPRPAGWSARASKAWRSRAAARVRRRRDGRKIEVRVDQPTRDPRAVASASTRCVCCASRGAARDRDALAPKRRHEHLLRAGGREDGGARRARRTSLPGSAGAFRCRLAWCRRGSCGAATGCAGTGRYCPERRSSRGASCSRRKRRAPKGPSASPSRSACRGTPGDLSILVADPDATLEAEGLVGPETAEVETGARSGAGRSPRLGRARSRCASRSRPRASRRRRLARGGACGVRSTTPRSLTETHVLRIDSHTHVLGNAGAPLLRIPLPEGARSSASEARTRARAGASPRRRARRWRAPRRPARRRSSSPTSSRAASRRRGSPARSRRGRPSTRCTWRTPAGWRRIAAPPPAPSAAHERPHLPALRGLRGGRRRRGRARAGQLPPSARGRGALALGLALAAAGRRGLAADRPVAGRRGEDTNAPEAELSLARREARSALRGHPRPRPRLRDGQGRGRGSHAPRRGAARPRGGAPGGGASGGEERRRGGRQAGFFLRARRSPMRRIAARAAPPGQLPPLAPRPGETGLAVRLSGAAGGELAARPEENPACRPPRRRSFPPLAPPRGAPRRGRAAPRRGACDPRQRPCPSRSRGRGRGWPRRALLAPPASEARPRARSCFAPAFPQRADQQPGRAGGGRQRQAERERAAPARARRELPQLQRDLFAGAHLEGLEVQVGEVVRAQRPAPVEALGLRRQPAGVRHVHRVDGRPRRESAREPRRRLALASW